MASVTPVHAGSLATGAATGAKESSTGSSAAEDAVAEKSEAVSKVESELKVANEELLSLETSLKLPVDSTTAKAANAAAKVAEDKKLRKASSNIDDLEKKLGMQA